jgi:hypothetical protein
MKWGWLWRGDMWAEPDPNHTPEFHTLGQDIRDLSGLVVKCSAWALGAVLALVLLLIVLALGAWISVQIVDLLRPVPVWAWLMIIPLFGIWWQIARRRDRER